MIYPNQLKFPVDCEAAESTWWDKMVARYMAAFVLNGGIENYKLSAANEHGGRVRIVNAGKIHIAHLILRVVGYCCSLSDLQKLSEDDSV